MVEHASETQLSMPEGVLLCHALVSRVADSRGIRAFFIKGPGSVMQGLRQPKTSTDVDVFVAPSGLQGMLQGLRDRGWRERPVDPDSSRIFPKHAVTLNHPEWPCCIDVHFRFPGMEHAPEDCLEVMWANTDCLQLAGQEVRVPSKALGILILALHALRSPQLPACRQELDFLTQLTEQQLLTAPILAIASEICSLAAVRPFLESLLPTTAMPEWPEPSTEWRNRLMAKEPGSAWLIAILRASWQNKLGMLWHAVFPPPEFFLSRDIYADMSVPGRLSQHQARWVRFLHAVPPIVRDLIVAQSWGGRACRNQPVSRGD